MDDDFGFGLLAVLLLVCIVGAYFFVGLLYLFVTGGK